MCIILLYQMLCHSCMLTDHAVDKKINNFSIRHFMIFIIIYSVVVNLSNICAYCVHSLCTPLLIDLIGNQEYKHRHWLQYMKHLCSIQILTYFYEYNFLLVLFPSSYQLLND